MQLKINFKKEWHFFRVCLLCLFSVLTFGLYAQQAEEIYASFHPGDIWKDSDGNHINAHGGGVMYKDGTYYWFGEHKGKTNSARVGVTVYSSEDLYNWKNEGVALAVTDDPSSEITRGCVLERPKVVYNKKTDKYVMWFHLELKGQGYSAARTGVAISDTPTGLYTYLKSYRPNASQWPANFKEEWKTEPEGGTPEKWWTPAWYKAVAKGSFVRKDFDKGQMSRDMTVFVDDDGKAYHIHSAEENLTLHLSELTDDYLDFTGKYITIAPAGHNEAPAIFKQDGIYYLITSGCTGWDPNAARSFKATSIWGPWEPLGNPCLGEGADLTFHSQSTYILPVKGKKDAYIFMADRWRPRNPIDGRYIWLPIEIEDGRPILEWKENWDLTTFNN